MHLNKMFNPTNAKQIWKGNSFSFTFNPSWVSKIQKTATDKKKNKNIWSHLFSVCQPPKPLEICYSNIICLGKQLKVDGHNMSCWSARRQWLLKCWQIWFLPAKGGQANLVNSGQVSWSLGVSLSGNGALVQQNRRKMKLLSTLWPAL